jgi:hypothetical protein
MIVVRNVFRLKFGMAAQGRDLMKEGLGIMARSGMAGARVLTDMTGPFYTLVFEQSYDTLAAFDQAHQQIAATPEWRAWYARLVPLVESGFREIFQVVA